MPRATQYRLNSPPVLHETIDHETIIVNLEVGTYYSLNPSGTSVWDGLERGGSIEQIVQSLAEQAGTSSTVVGDGVRVFIAQLLVEKLIVAQEDGAQTADLEAVWPANLGFEPPSLTRYTDMQELLLLDPVHDVGADGWPGPR